MNLLFEVFPNDKSNWNAFKKSKNLLDTLQNILQNQDWHYSSFSYDSSQWELSDENNVIGYIVIFTKGRNEKITTFSISYNNKVIKSRNCFEDISEIILEPFELKLVKVEQDNA